MFDELKGVQNRFKKYKAEVLQKAEAYLEPKQASTMELFCEYT